MSNLERLAEIIFPDIHETIEDLEKRYPPRNLKEGAKVTRFAPSPTGFLHTGSLFTSFIDKLVANQSEGVFFIRLEDTDTKREIKGAGDSLLKEMAIFNCLPDEGYFGDDNESGDYGPYRQSRRGNIYKTVIKEMIKKDLAYPCFCTPEDLASLRAKQEEEKLIPGYYGEHAKCRNLTVEEAIEKIQNGDRYVIRFKSKGNHLNKVEVDDEIRGHLELSENDQDIVILKSDDLLTYHFAHLVDDHFMHTTHVIRGEEWLPSLPLHIELFSALGFELPKYAHVPVIMKVENGNRRKLSKRKDAEAAVSFFLELGYPTDGFLEYLLTIANSNFEEWRLANKDASMYDFTLTFNKMSLDGALFDLAKVQNICKELLSRLSAKEISERAIEWAKKYNEDLYRLATSNIEFFESIMNIERGGEKPRKDYEKYSDILPLIGFFYNEIYSEIAKNEWEWNLNMDKELIKEVLSAYKDSLDLELSEEEWFANMKNVAIAKGFAGSPKEWKKNKEAFKGHVGDVAEMLRISMSGRKQTPNLYYVMKILGQEEVNRRIDVAINKL